MKKAFLVGLDHGHACPGRVYSMGDTHGGAGHSDQRSAGKCIFTFSNFSCWNSAYITATSNEFVNVTGYVYGLGTFSEGVVMKESGSSEVSALPILSSVCGRFNLTFMSNVRDWLRSRP